MGLRAVACVRFVNSQVSPSLDDFLDSLIQLIQFADYVVLTQVQFGDQSGGFTQFTYFAEVGEG